MEISSISSSAAGTEEDHFSQEDRKKCKDADSAVISQLRVWMYPTSYYLSPFILYILYEGGKRDTTFM